MSTMPKVVTAQDVRELKKALQKVPAEGQWLVEHGQNGHASIRCFDTYGNLHTVINNKG